MSPETEHPTDHRITTEAQLAEIYGTPAPASLLKEMDHVTAEYAALMRAAPFCVLASSGPGGLDCSPRGDAPGFVELVDEKTLALPDRRGNNRIDTLRNIIADPRVALLFLIPGVNETLRVNGRAEIHVGPDLLQRYVTEGKAPRSVLLVRVETVYFQCAKALVRSKLWHPDQRVDRKSLPSAGQILEAVSAKAIDAASYDAAQPERHRQTMW